MTGTTHQFDFAAEVVGVSTKVGGGGGAVEALDLRHHADFSSVFVVVQMDGIGVEVVDPLELLAHAQGTVDGGALDLRQAFQVIEQLNAVADIPDELVDEGKNRRVAQSGDGHQLDGALFHALG